MTPQDKAFLDADFHWVSTLQGIWRDHPSHVEALQQAAADRIMDAFRTLRRENAENAVGQVVNGPAGSGKTHLIGTLRRSVWAEGGWFVLIDVVGITDFWRTAAFGFIRSLRQSMPDGRSQYQAVFEAALEHVPQETRRKVFSAGEDLGSGAIRTVNFFVRALQAAFPQEGMQHSNVVRALLLQGDPDAAEIAYSWLQGLEIDVADRRPLGFTAPSPPPEAIVAGVSWLMSLGGPVMIAVDQIDAIVTAGNIVAEVGAGKAADLDDETEARARSIIQVLAGGLMDLFDQTHRTMTVVTCLNETWSILRQKALQSALHRFVPAPLLLNSSASAADSVAALIAGRLAPAFARHSVEPPSPTWPFLPSVLAELKGNWPRQILMQCEAYRLRCLGAGEVLDCARLNDEVTAPSPPPDLAAAFTAHRASAKIGDLVSSVDDGGPVGACLRDALALYARQLTLPESVDAAIAALATDPRPALHARLSFTFHEQNELEKHYCFRVLAHASALAVQPRLRAAMTDAGVDKKLPFRHLFIVRNEPMPSGKVTKQLCDRLAADGGVVVPLSVEDLRTFAALRDMDTAKLDGFDAWLRECKPLCETSFFQSVGLCPPPVSPTEAAVERQAPISDALTTKVLAAEPIPTSREAPSAAGSPSASPTSPATAGEEAQESGSAVPSQLSLRESLPATIVLGTRVQGGGTGPEVRLPVSLLTRHTAIFAGSGSGKTVLLRRIVEEVALRGVPAIVLDTNNDLARLGLPWPERPAAFSDADVSAAARYADTVEVVVWTPGVAAGRPLTLAVLPDFSALKGTGASAERAEAVTMAFATLAPLVGAKGASKDLKEGVLTEALASFAVEGRSGIDAFIDYLADLPAEVSKQSKATKLSGEMADQLRAKIALNPLLSAAGQPLDPSILFTAERADATRISVINLAGLSDDSRQDFVNQLQMALFTFIRKHPSATPRLYVVDEAQNFAPSQTNTASKASAKALAAQARKFGLGLIFATQAPKGIDTNIVSNCTTHVYGRMSSPALIAATEEMMAAKGKAAKDLGSLSAGLFYVATEGLAQPVKIRAPLCLSWHPQNPATPEQIVEMTAAK